MKLAVCRKQSEKSVGSVEQIGMMMLVRMQMMMMVVVDAGSLLLLVDTTLSWWSCWRLSPVS
jgi:hypothetical protein